MLKHLRLLLVPCIFLFAGCTREYRPVSAWESGVYSHSNKGVFPNDVRSNPEAFRNTVIAWVGILTSADIHDENPDHPYVDLYIEHHYFDWIEDRGAQAEHYFLSPRGEGPIHCSWPFKKSWDIDAMRRLIANGDMVVVYGVPKGVDGGTIDLGVAQYVREIKPPLFATDILEYGRPGEPHRVLRTAIAK